MSAAAMDGGFFLIMVAMPFKVLALGGGALELGLVAAIGAFSYIVCAPVTGHLSDRGGRTALCLAGGVVLATAAALAWLVRRLDLLLAVQALMGLGKALYWPAVQATLGDLGGGRRRAVVLGRFNLAWSGGKTLGFLLGGWLLSCCGFRGVYLAGAAAVILAFVALPKGALVAAALRSVALEPSATGPTLATGGDTAAHLRSLRTMGWIANAAAYSAFGILSSHLPQWFTAQGWDPQRYGWFLGLILTSQTITFLLATGPWRPDGSVRRLWTLQVVAVAAVAAIPWLDRFGGLLAVAPLIGLACGTSYTASLYHSLDAADVRGRNAGIHEALVGVGGFLPPLAAGLLVKAGLGLSAPYLLAAGLLVAGLVAQVGIRAAAARS